MLDWLWWLLDTNDFVSRWQCGHWDIWLIVTSQVADFSIALAYFTIPLLLWRLWIYKRQDFPKSWIVVAFAVFILSCGIGHLFNGLVFWWPAYRLFIFNDVITSLSSGATAFGLLTIMNFLITYPSSEQFRSQVARAEAAEQEAIKLAEQANSLRLLAEEKIRRLSELANQMAGDLHTQKEARELRSELSKYRREIAVATEAV